MKKTASLLGLAFALTFANAAIAHPEHEEPRVVSQKQVKLDAKASANGATITVTNGGDALPTAGATGTLTLLGTSGRQVIQLQPAGTNTMEARSKARIAPGSKALASITFADRSKASAELTID